ncbi:hypothetical protein SAMN05216264_11340 [Pseudomonas marincola]|nr:hypothetical protein SAMN05216264_11340 [Pseudomonas marincola]
MECGDDWHTAAPLWLIENQALFGDISWRPADASGTLRYYSGQLQTETHHRSKKKGMPRTRRYEACVCTKVSHWIGRPHSSRIWRIM